MRNYNFHYSTMISFVVILIVSLAPLDSNATLLFEIERVSDTKANITGTGILDTAEPTGVQNVFSFKKPFGIAPPSTDNRIIDDDGSTLQIGFPTVDIAWILGSGMFAAGGDPWIYIGKFRGSYVPGSTVTGSLSITLPSGITFAAPGSTGLVNWGIGTEGIDAGTWVMVSSSTPTYSVGGSVSGLAGSVTLQNNSSDDIIKTTNDGFTFTAQAEGSDYAVTVSSQPTGQTCTVTNGSGTNITANITNVTVTCVTDVVPTYSVGGTVSGLTGSVTLQNNSGDDIIKTTNDGFTFPAQADSSAYAVTVSSQPTGQTCTVTDGSGTIATADVTNVAVTCVTDVVPTYSVGGTASGLTGAGLALQNNGGDTLVVAADGPFTFLTELTETSSYAVTVSAQPTGQTCSVTNGSGTIAEEDVADVGVACVDDVLPPVKPPIPATPVPTLSQWALVMLSMFLGLMVFANRRRLF